MSAASRRGPGRPKHFEFTPTDRAVIEKIAKSGFQSYSELRSNCLKGTHRCHSWKLMKRLVKAGVLNETRGDHGGILGWTLKAHPKKEISFLDSKVHGKAFKGPVYRTSYLHDVQLRNIKDILEASPAIVEWIPEYVLRSEVMRAFGFRNAKERSEKLLAVPDALLHLYTGGQHSKAALELELTQKSRKRLYQKMEAYILSKDFDYAFFIAATDHLATLLRDVFQDVKANSWKVRIAKSKNGIYFATLEDILKHGLDARFSAAHDTLTFAELSK